MKKISVKVTMYCQIHCDKTYTYPRESLNAMAEIGLLGLLVPKEFGGLGENHVCASMVIETVARYGCPSTAMVYSKLYFKFII